MQYHTPEKRDPQLQFCENLNTHFHSHYHLAAYYRSLTIKTFTTINNDHVYLHQARTPSVLFHTFASSSNAALTLTSVTGLPNNS